MSHRSRRRERVPTPVPKKKLEAQASIPVEKEWNEQVRRELKPWYIIALEGENCALFFIRRVHSLIKSDKIVENAMQEALNEWFDQRSVNNALDSGYVTFGDIDDLEIPIGYYPEIVARIKQEYKKHKKVKKII